MADRGYVSDGRVLQKDVSGGAGQFFAPARQLVDANGVPLGSAASPIYWSFSPDSARFTDGYAVIPPSRLIPLPVTHIAYVNPVVVAGGSSSNIACLQATCSTGAASALVQCDVSDLLNRTTAGKGLTVNGVTIFWTITTAVLTAGPSCTFNQQTFGAVGAAAAAPTFASVGGSVTSTPATTQTAIPTAGQFYGTTFTPATPFLLNSALAAAYAEFTFPCSVGTVLQIARVSVAYSDQVL